MTNHRRYCANNPIKPTHKFGFKLNQYSKAKLLGLPRPTPVQKGRPGKGTPHNEEFKEKQRQRALERNLGGVRPSKWINYRGKILGSSYELKLVQDLEAHGIKWDTCKRFAYTDPFGKIRTYTPDIYLPEYDVYLDPKNDYLINNVNPKLGFTDVEKIKCVMDQNNIRILILNKLQLQWSVIKMLL
jgi:hypothetical protein